MEKENILEENSFEGALFGEAIEMIRAIEKNKPK